MQHVTGTNSISERPGGAPPPAEAEHTVLVADDQFAVRRLIELTLEGGKFVLLQAADGDEALRLAREHHPSIIFLDWEMPGLSGVEVCRTLRAEQSRDSVQVVLLSGRAYPADMAAGLAAGADAYLVKPFSPLELLDRVSEALGSDVLD